MTDNSSGALSAKADLHAQSGIFSTATEGPGIFCPEEDCHLTIGSKYKKTAVTFRRYRKKNVSKKENDDTFKFHIHRALEPVLEKIKVPELAPFVPDPFQLKALEALPLSDVLVTAPTGSGKTYIAIKAIESLFREGARSWYASPLKALSNAKYEEFSNIFGGQNVGILTGDRKENADAPIIVGTTEILRNQLYDTMHRGEDLPVDLVVLDEAHYLGDPDRGVVWEEVLIYLPTRARLLMLSATIQNAQEICDWLDWLRQKRCRWIKASERPVPLYPLFLFPSGELSPLSGRRGLYGKIRSVDPGSFSPREFLDIPRLMEALRKANLLPAIFFLKSRADCEKAIAMCPRVSRPKSGTDASKRFFSQLHDLLDAYPFLRQHQHLAILKKCRVGAHHGGQLPHWKLLLEKLMQAGHLDAIFATSTVAAGVNFPARTVVIPQSDRFNGKEFVPLSATDLLQMTGRAGRRGMDEIGFALVVPGRYQDPQLIHDLFNSPPDSIQSQIRINFSMILNLLLSHTPEEIRTLLSASFATFQNLNEDPRTAEEFQQLKKTMRQWLAESACGTIENFEKVQPEFQELQNRVRQTRKRWNKQATQWAFEGLLDTGRLFRNRRGGVFVAVSPPAYEAGVVEAVRVAFPLHWKKGNIRTYRVQLRRIAQLGRLIADVPRPMDRKKWEKLVHELASQPFNALAGGTQPEALPVEQSNRELARLILQKAELPCERCDLFGPCQKGSSHPFTHLIAQYFQYKAQLSSIQEELWRSFKQHLDFLQNEGYVDAKGHLTQDGLWACNLRIDQPLLISEGIRKSLFPEDQPELLAALIAPFVMDRDRVGDIQLSALMWKYPDMAKPFCKMLHELQPLMDHLKTCGFPTVPLPFWTTVTLHQWALGQSWDEVREVSGMAEGDLAMVILRTADHLRQIESLTETHPRLADSARKAIDLILREPVLIE